MSHIYSVLTGVSSKLNTLFKDYAGEGRANTLSKVPDFAMIAVTRALVHNPDLAVSSDANLILKKPIIINTEDDFNPIYVFMVENATTHIIDRIPIFVDRKGTQGPGIATIIGIPELLFNDFEYESTIKRLRSLFLDILATDTAMKFEADPILLRLSKSTSIKVDTYDITMMLAAFACTYINIRSWFANTDAVGNQVPIEASQIVKDMENLPDDIKTNLSRALGKYAKTYNELRDSITTGKLIKEFLTTK